MTCSLLYNTFAQHFHSLVFAFGQDNQPECIYISSTTTDFFLGLPRESTLSRTAGGRRRLRHQLWSRGRGRGGPQRPGRGRRQTRRTVPGPTRERGRGRRRRRRARGRRGWWRSQRRLPSCRRSLRANWARHRGSRRSSASQDFASIRQLGSTMLAFPYLLISLSQRLLHRCACGPRRQGRRPLMVQSCNRAC